MKLSKYILGLGAILKKEGDMDVFMSSDTEGNNTHSVDKVIDYAVTHLSEINDNAIVKGVVLYPKHDTWETLSDPE